MSRVLHKVSTLARMHFTVFDEDDAVVTGAVDGDFTKRLAKDDANDTTTVTVAEIANGRYVASFTPTSTGAYYLTVSHATHAPRGWQESFDVTTGGPVVADSNGRVDVGLWVGQAPDALSSGRVLVHVVAFTGGVITAGAIADNAITAAKIATGAIDADALAASAVTSIQSGLATSAAVAALPTAAANATAVGALSKDGYTLLEHVGIASGVLAGKASGGPSGTAFRDLSDSRDVVTTSANGNGDRASVTIVP